MSLDLPVAAPLKPMLAKRVDAIPSGDGWRFEPKWDGFRALVFRSGDHWLLQSRDLKPLNRYFPELEEPFRRCLPSRSVIDGEIVIAGASGLDFEALLQRIHPAASRVHLLAEQTPASFVAFDMLAAGDDDLTGLAFAHRRACLEEALRGARPPLYLTPATSDTERARDWFTRFEGAGLDGVIAKAEDAPYTPGKRTMLKIKHARTADCVVAGFRWHKGGLGTMVGSLVLGLYEGAVLHHVGVAASFTAARRRELVAELAPFVAGASASHPWSDWMEAGGGQRIPDAGSRWSRGKDLSWEPLRPELVVEVAYDHMQGRRFRHTTHVQRWRPDKPAAECTYEQLQVTPAYELGEIFHTEG